MYMHMGTTTLRTLLSRAAAWAVIQVCHHSESRLEKTSVVYDARPV